MITPGDRDKLIAFAGGLVLATTIALLVVHDKKLRPEPVDSCLVQRVESLEHRAATLERRMIERVKEKKP